MNQKINQIKPKAPVAIKAIFQSYRMASQGTINGAITAPTLVPELKIPPAYDLSFRGNHSATVLNATGKLPASVTPKKERYTIKLVVPVAKACKILAMLHNINMMAYPGLVPILSMRRPALTIPTA